MCTRCAVGAAAACDWREGLQSRLPARGPAQRARAGCGSSQQVLQAPYGESREGTRPAALLIVSPAVLCLHVLSVRCCYISTCIVGAMSLHVCNVFTAFTALERLVCALYLHVPDHNSYRLAANARYLIKLVLLCILTTCLQSHCIYSLAVIIPMFDF